MTQGRRPMSSSLPLRTPSLALYQTPACGELGQIYVLPSRQGQGVGRALVREMVRHLADQGIYSLHVGECKKLT